MNQFRWLVVLMVCCIASNNLAFADAFRCPGANGKVLFSSTPCDGASKVQRSDYISPDQQQNAQSDLERQKQFLRMREREAQSSTGYASSHAPQGTGYASEQAIRERIHSCLMAVTATTGISSYESGRRRVQCYSGTKGLLDECEMRVTGTGGLTSQQEQNLRSMCKSMTSA